MTIETVDFTVLTRLYRSNALVRAIFEWIGDRDRDPRGGETKAGNLLGDLAKRGERFTIDQIRDALDQISKSGCGTYKAGRPIENSRITWQCSARELAAIVLEEVADGGAEAGGEEETETHYFPVRPGLTLPVRIRADMTAAELQNMSEFLQIIAKSRGTKGEGAVK